MEAAKKTDIRYARTHELIRSVFIGLLEEKEFRAISVTEITRRCNINRKTFYLHYNSTEELLAELSDEVFDMLSEKTEEYMKSVEVPTYEGLFFLLDSVIQANYEFYMCILTSPQYLPLIIKMQNHLAELFIPFINPSLPLSETQRKMMVYGVASAVFEMHRRNKTENLGYSSQEIFELTNWYINIDYLVL